MKMDKTEFTNREKHENGLADKSELSAKIERVVSSLLEVVIQYLKTIILISFRPFKSSLILSTEIERDRNTTSNPMTFLVISTAICSLFISISYLIWIESNFDYHEIAFLTEFTLAKAIKDSTSLTNILLTSFPGIVASVLSVLIIRRYLNAKEKQVIRCNGVWYIAIAFSGMLISISALVFVFFIPAILGMVIGKAMGAALGGGGGFSTSDHLFLAFFNYFPLLPIFAALFYSTVLVAKSYECINKTHFIKTLHIKSFRVSVPTFRLLLLPVVLAVSITIYLGGISLPTAIEYLMGTKEIKGLVISVYKKDASTSEEHFYALLKNTSRHDIVFSTDSISLTFKADNYQYYKDHLGELVSIYGGKDNPVKILKSGETQWLILKSKIPEDVCEFISSGNDAVSVYFMVVIKNVYTTDEPFRNNDEFLGTSGSGEEIRSKRKYLCSRKEKGKSYFTRD